MDIVIAETKFTPPPWDLHENLEELIGNDVSVLGRELRGCESKCSAQIVNYPRRDLKKQYLLYLTTGPTSFG